MQACWYHFAPIVHVTLVHETHMQDGSPHPGRRVGSRMSPGSGGTTGQLPQLWTPLPGAPRYETNWHLFQLVFVSIFWVFFFFLQLETFSTEKAFFNWTQTSSNVFVLCTFSLLRFLFLLCSSDTSLLSICVSFKVNLN